ncbi:MAG: flagellar motor protein MotB [Herminiimonas sp.]|nr:flagellar motor protein MotB [Herminiimonas sp.]MDB5852912.1 flagellar motor protein MotB [Herminiimonas sp.]
MKLSRASGTFGLVAFAIAATPFAMAQEAGWYAGANVGQSRAKIDDARITGGLQASGLATTSINDDDRSTGYKLYGGYQINRNFALEGGYFDLGKFGFTANTAPAGTLSGNTRMRGLNLDLVGILPITEKFSAFARAGVAYAEAKDNFSGTGAVNVLNPNPSRREANYKLGLGVQYELTQALAMRGEVERYRVNDAVGNRGDINLVSVGLVYRFGGRPPAPRAAAPEPVMMAAAPQPVVEAPPPPPPQPVAPPAPRKVSFSADSLFGFDQSDVKPSGRQALDKFASDLKGTDFDRISVTGHTDRISSHAYNLKLSARRADAVKAYLVQNAGIPAAKIAAKGVNGSDPVTKPGECKGTKPTKQLIACLQPDRRVDVEVTGTR